MTKISCKSIFLPAILMLLSTCIQAQTEYIVRVDPNNGHIHKVDSIPGVTWLKGYETPAYSEHRSWFTFFGGDDPSGNPFYLFTVYGNTGSTLWNPYFPDHPFFVSMQYARNTDALYGGVRINSLSSIVSIDPLTGNYSVIQDLPGISSILKLIIDDAHNRFYISGPDNMGDLKLFTIDMTNGNIISQPATPRINNLVYNQATGVLYAMSNRDAPMGAPHPTIFSLCTVDPVSGTINNIADIPNIAGFISGDETLDENNGRYFFTASEWNDAATYLYSIDVNTGNIIHKVVIPQNGGIANNNLIQFRYDNNQDTLYALYWEAHTDVIVPLLLNKFDAVLQDRSVLCNWQTLQELNCNHFEIERSEDGRNFISAGNVAAVGNSSAKQDYRFTDINAASLNKDYLYYRLKMVDDNARFSYSNTVKVKLGFESALTIFPNPVKEHLSFNLISTADNNAMILVTNAAGKTLYKKELQIRKGNYYYQVSDLFLVPGRYTVSITGKNNYSGSFVKL